MLTARHSAVICVALACAAGAFAVPVARAGEWVQVSCVDPSGQSAPAQGWSAAGGGGLPVGSHNSLACSNTQPMTAVVQGGASVGAYETLTYQPPPGSQLAGGTLGISMSPGPDGNNASPVTTLEEPANAYDGDVFYQCTTAFACNGYTGTAALPSSLGGNLYIGASCGGTSGFTCPGGASASVLWAQLLLANSSSPTGSAFSGTLLSPAAHGTATVAFTAADPGGPGVYQVTVQIDNTTLYKATPNTQQGQCAPVGSYPGTSALMFDYQQPCPQTTVVDASVDTTNLGDGQHELKVTVTDAAGNTSTVLDQRITTANRTTVSALLNSTGSKSTASSSYVFVLDPATRTLVRGVRRSYRHSALTLTGTLQTQAGIPAPGAPVALWAQPPADGPSRELAHTTTDGTGHWTLTAAQGASRVLRLLAATDGQTASTAGGVSLTETVSPTLSLHIATPGAGLLDFTGRVGIAPLGRPRPLVIIEVHGPQGWQSVGAPVRTGPGGRYRYHYRSSPVTIGRSFQFRAVTPASPLWHGTTSAGHRATVH